MSNSVKIKDLISLINKKNLEKFTSLIDLCIEDEIMYMNRYNEKRNYHVAEHEMAIQTLKQIKKRLK